MDTTFPADVQPLVDRILALCREQMTEGAVTPVTYVIDSAKQTMVPVEMHMPNAIAKDVAAALVRWTAKNIKADMTIMVTEAWSLSQKDAKHYNAIIEQYGSIGEYPGHLDILMVQVETRAGHWMGRAPIETKGKARRCGPLEVVKGDSASGRFSHFLSDEDMK
jgi:hypothetical protein